MINMAQQNNGGRGKGIRDFSKEKIGKFQPLYIDETKPRGAGHNIYWICRCECGNEVSISSSTLRIHEKANDTNYCCKQCRKTPLENLIGQKFGKLEVIAHDDNYKATAENDWKHKWICKCDCGNIISVFASNLKRLHTTSCGCANRSIGEENIEKILKENNINFAHEYSFNDLKNEKKLRFDFAIFNKNNELIELIEFDGRQHNNDYTPWGNKETLLERQYKDNLKNDYCQKHNIKLIRINYNKRDNITLKDLELENYYECN